MTKAIPSKTQVCWEELPMNDEQKEILEIYLQEYSKLKDEQIQRIQFRDQLIYITLGVFGGILAFALGENPNAYALLVFPLVSIVLGWTYLINDEKTTRIGKYIDEELSTRIKALNFKGDNYFIEAIFGWEKYYRIDPKRSWRKKAQLLINEVTFVFSGISTLLAFCYLEPKSQWFVQIILGVEFFLLLFLGWAIFVYADLPKKNSKKEISRSKDKVHRNYSDLQDMYE